MKYILLRTKRVETKIRGLLRNKFCLAFDGWTEDSTHVLAIFASVPFENEHKYNTFLLGFSHLGQKLSQNANEHKKYAEYVWSLIWKYFEDVVALSGDNCSTNQSFELKFDSPLIVCSPHRYTGC